MKKYILIGILCGSVLTARAASEEALALARDIIKLSEAPKLTDNLLASTKQMRNMMAPASMSAEEKAKADKMFEKIMEVMKPEMEAMLQKMEPIFAEVYTIDELKAMKAYYESPAGRSIMAKQPLMMEKTMALSIEMQKTLAPKMMELMMGGGEK